MLSRAAEAIRARLFSLQDKEYAAFQSKLIPSIDPQTVIGVRVPQLRALARELSGTEDAARFLRELPHAYYEENCLHGLLIAAMRGYEPTVDALNTFLPYLDNWAACDILHPRAFARHPEPLPDQLHRWLQSERPYTVRFALGMLMSLYLDEEFRPEYAEWAAQVRSDEYYVNMMAAWYFATALAKRYEEILPYLTGHRLPLWTHNKSIQKAIESRRISPERKEELRALRRGKADAEGE